MACTVKLMYTLYLWGKTGERYKLMHNGIQHGNFDLILAFNSVLM